ncbi:MAG: hypothetical protein AAFV88_14065 [Planctomycetota bacterium]
MVIESNPTRQRYVSTNRVMAQRLYMLQFPPKHTPRRKPPTPTPPISNRTRARVAAMHPRKRTSAAAHQAEFAERRRKRFDRMMKLDPENAIVATLTAAAESLGIKRKAA